ncbi:MAG: dehydrogenase [Acidobacteria bacterium]|nr:dehydrogenase [Acidobacteriota bacterium]|tara:strand:+ start:2685 stop:3500 length:816 start_codon:yes stop_codon:yes gene_type:complete
MSDPFRLDGLVAVVTGAAGKLGPIWVEALLDAGAAVFAVELDGAEISSAFESLRGVHDETRLVLHRADVLDRDALIVARDTCGRTLGGVHVLVNNAGIDQPASVGGLVSHRLEDVPLDVCRTILEVNTLGTFQVTQVFGAEMVKARRGSIINIGSLYASVSPDARLYDHMALEPPFLKPPAYGASKAAVVNLTRYFSTVWGPYGVRVNTLSPGGVLGDQDPEFQRKFNDRVPLGRMAVDADLRGPLRFLASDASSYVTGTELRVDGGFTAW